MKTVLLSATALLLSAFQAFSQSYVVVNIDTKVFDQPNAQEYVTQNQQGQDVVLSPGMAFLNTDSTPGWDVIEYTPGLRGYIMKTNEVAASALKAPAPGAYKVNNNPSQTVTVAHANGAWSLKAGAAPLSGKAFGNIIVFFDKNGNQAYTLVDYGKGPVVMTYSNSVTHFF